MPGGGRREVAQMAFNEMWPRDAKYLQVEGSPAQQRTVLCDMLLAPHWEKLNVSRNSFITSYFLPAGMDKRKCGQNLIQHIQGKLR